MPALLAMLVAAALLGAPKAATSAPAQWTTPSSAEVRQILVRRIDAEHQGVGIVVGVIDSRGRRVVSYGALAKGDPRPLDGSTIFEIGSSTKVFTSLLLSDMVQRGEVALDDPIAKYLPKGLALPQRGGRQITLVDLATHTSGLPRMPTNFAPKYADNPYADYTVDQLYTFLAGYQLPRDIGSQYEYSNLGAGLLGQVLARRESVDYATALQRHVTGPLGMSSTVITLTPEMQQRLAAGYTATLDPARNWDLPTLAGAGALRSDANDLLTFLAAELGYQETPLAGAMKAQLSAVRRPTNIPNTQVALGWNVSTDARSEVVWHNGGTGGYRSFIGFNPQTGVGVVVLANVASAGGGDDIGFHILRGTPLAVLAPPTSHTAVSLDEGTLERLVGRYQLAPTVTMEVTREGRRLFAQLAPVHYRDTVIR
jgi:CubicO group peptidase (beta-lactamase class C family)